MNTIHHSVYSLVNSGAHHVLNIASVHSHSNTNRRIIQIRTSHGNRLSSIPIQGHMQQDVTAFEKHPRAVNDHTGINTISVHDRISQILNIRPRAPHVLSKLTAHA